MGFSLKLGRLNIIWAFLVKDYIQIVLRWSLGQNTHANNNMIYLYKCSMKVTTSALHSHYTLNIAFSFNSAFF